LDGQQIKQGRDWQNNQVWHSLYHTFIQEEYSCLLDEKDEDNVEGCNGLPHMPLPCCVERSSSFFQKKMTDGFRDLW